MGKNRVKKFMEKNGQLTDYEFFNPAFLKVCNAVMCDLGYFQHNGRSLR